MLRRRSPSALIELFESWQANKGAKSGSKPGVIDYFERSHPDAAERIRVLVAVNGIMEGNKEVYPVELRNKKQSREAIPDLLAELDSPAYLADVRSDFFDRMQRFHRRRIQALAHTNLDKYVTLLKYGVPSLPLNPVLAAQVAPDLEKFLERSDRDFIAELTIRMGNPSSGQLRIEERIKLNQMLKTTLGTLGEQREETRGEDNQARAEKQNQYRARVQAFPEYQTLANVLARSERILRIDLNQIFHGK